MYQEGRGIQELQKGPGEKLMRGEVAGDKLRDIARGRLEGGRDLLMVGLFGLITMWLLFLTQMENSASV